MTKFSPSLCEATEIPNMAAGGHSNMAAVGKKIKSYCEAYKIV